MIRNGYAAAEELQLADWFRTWTPDAGKGYMWSSHANIGRLSMATEADGHSGASFAWMCRQLQFFYKDPASFQRAWDKPAPAD